MVGYSLTQHAHRRCREREITQDDLAHALAGEGAETRVRVILAPDRPTVVTVYRMTRSEGRAFYAAMRTQGSLL